MRKFSKGSQEAEVDLTPMLDIVFIMLIFFIVTASFVKESGIEINKPEDTPAQDNPPPPDEKKRAIAFLISSNNRIMHEFRTVDVASVGSIIKKESVERPEASVVIQAEQGAHFGIAIQIYDAALSVGLPQDKIVVTPKN